MYNKLLIAKPEKSQEYLFLGHLESRSALAAAASRAAIFTVVLHESVGRAWSRGSTVGHDAPGPTERALPKISENHVLIL